MFILNSQAHLKDRNERSKEHLQVNHSTLDPSPLLSYYFRWHFFKYFLGWGCWLVEFVCRIRLNISISLMYINGMGDFYEVKKRDKSQNHLITFHVLSSYNFLLHDVWIS